MNHNSSSIFNGKVIAVTGGASGLGADCVQPFIESGARVFIIDRNADLAASTAAALGRRSHRR